MIRLYHPKSRVVRELADGDTVRLRALKRAGFLVGDLPAVLEPKPEPGPEPLEATEEVDAKKAVHAPVMAQHAELIPEGVSPDDEKALEELAEEVDEATAEVDERVAQALERLEAMPMPELRKMAKDQDIKVPFVITKVGLAQLIVDNWLAEEAALAEDVEEIAQDVATIEQDPEKALEELTSDPSVIDFERPEGAQPEEEVPGEETVSA